MTEETLKPVVWMSVYKSGESPPDKSEPLVRLSDAQAALTEKDKRIAELEERLSRSYMDGHIEAAEARIAELETRLAIADKVIEPFSTAEEYSRALNTDPVGSVKVI